MSVRDSINQVLEPIYRGEKVILDLEPDEGLTYTLGGSTFEFAIGTTLESPTFTVSSTAGANGEITVPSGDTVRVTMETAATKTLTAARNYWTLTEIISSARNVVASGIVDVRKGAGTLP